MAITQTQVSQLYVALIGRASEGEGNVHWQNETNMTVGAENMLASSAAQAYFGTSLDTNQAFIEHIYLNTLNKTVADDAAGIAHWVAALDAGASRGEVVVGLIDAVMSYGPGGANAGSTDAQAVAAYNQFANRVEVSNYMADTVWTAPADLAVSTFGAAALNVTDAPASVVAAKAAVDDLPTPVQTMTLTTDQDIYTPTSETPTTEYRDVIRGVAGRQVGLQDDTTLNSSDILDGGAGSDLLALLINGNYGGGATITNIETLQLGTNNILVPVNFDYNVNAGIYEVDGVNEIYFDQITAGETLNVNNLTPSAAGDVVPVLRFDNEPGSVAGNIGVTYRQASIAGATTQGIELDNITNGVMNIAAGMETFVVASTGGTANTLNYSAVSGGTADLFSSLTSVVLQGDTALGTVSAIRQIGEDGATALGDGLLSVAAGVTSVDASEMSGAANVRFVGGGNVDFQGGSAGDYVEFEAGNITADGNDGGDTFAFVTDAAPNSGFGERDVIDGGDGVDTIQLGLDAYQVADGAGGWDDFRYDVGQSELRNKFGIDVLDLRGAQTFVTLSDEFVARTDSGDTIIINTNNVDDVNVIGPVGAVRGQNEAASVHTVDMTFLASSQYVDYNGGLGSDRLIVDDAVFNAGQSLSGGGGVNTITFTNDRVVADAQDLSVVSGFDGFILTKDALETANYRFDLTSAFAAANGVPGGTIAFATAPAANSAALGAGDTVVFNLDGLGLTGSFDLTSLAEHNVNVVFELNGVQTAAVPAGFGGFFGDFTGTIPGAVGAVVGGLGNTPGSALNTVIQNAAYIDQTLILDTTIGVDGVDLNVLGRDAEVSQPTLQAFDTIIGNNTIFNNDLNFNGAVAGLQVSSAAGQPFQNVTGIFAVNLDDGVTNTVNVVDTAMFWGNDGIINAGTGTNTVTIDGNATANPLSLAGDTLTLTGNNTAGSTTNVNLFNVDTLDDLSGVFVAGTALGTENVTITGQFGDWMDTVFGGAGAGTEINIGANVDQLTVNNSGASLTVDLSANVAPVVILNNDDDVIFAGAGFAAGLTDLTVDVSSATAGATVDFSAEAGNLVPVNTDVILGASNGTTDNVDVTGVSTVTDMTNVITIHNFEAGAGNDTITVTPAAVTNLTAINLNGTTVANFIADANAAGGGFLVGANDALYITVTNSGALDGTYALIDSDGSNNVNAGDEIVELVGVTGTLDQADFI